MSTPNQAPVPILVKAAAAASVVGALTQVGGGILETVDRVLPPDPGYALRTTLIAVAYLLMLGGVISLNKSGAAGNGWLARIGVTVAGLGWLTWAIAQILLQIDFTFATTVVFPAGLMMIGIGMIVAGIAVLRVRRWCGWRRAVPVACGLYLVPLTQVTFAVLGEPSFLVFAGFGLCWLLLGVALWTSPATPQQRTDSRVIAGRLTA